MFKSLCLRQQRGEFQLTGRDELWKLLVAITIRKARNAAKAQRRDKRDIAREQTLPGNRACGSGAARAARRFRTSAETVARKKGETIMTAKATKALEIKLDNLSTGIMHNEGSISEDGKVITNLGKSHDPATGKRYKLRTVTTIVDHDHFTLEWFGTEEGGKESKVVSMAHTRKKT